jgi:hypothetical protein
MKSFCPAFFKKGAAPPTQDATQSAEKSGNSEKVCFFCTFLQGISKKRAAGGIDSPTKEKNNCFKKIYSKNFQIMIK